MSTLASKNKSSLLHRKRFCVGKDVITFQKNQLETETPFQLGIFNFLSLEYYTRYDNNAISKVLDLKWSYFKVSVKCRPTETLSIKKI